MSTNIQGSPPNKAINSALYDCNTFDPERKNSRLYNEDLAPLQPEQRNWVGFRYLTSGPMISKACLATPLPPPYF